ncbi:hypothetical protein D3C73_970610 [compost metagenome]
MVLVAPPNTVSSIDTLWRAKVRASAYWVFSDWDWASITACDAASGSSDGLLTFLPLESCCAAFINSDWLSVMPDMFCWYIMLVLIRMVQIPQNR